MNKYIKIIGMGLGCMFTVSCSEISFGDNFLGDQPESSGATTEQMFSSMNEADKVLTRAYQDLPYGLPAGNNNKLGGNILESLTDLCQSFRDNVSDGPMKMYYNGALSSTTVDQKSAYLYGGETDWNCIRYAWLYIENVDKVPDMTDEKKAERIAEAKTLIALSYYEMMRYVGGVVWLNHSIDVNEEMTFPRITFAQTVENIVTLLDEAIPHLPWTLADVNKDEGRMTQAGAMALKFKTLMWAASPTFNSNDKWHSEADEYTCYGNYDAERWTRAAKAGKEFFDALKTKGGYSLVQPTADTHQARRLAYRRAYYDRGTSELIITTRKGYDEGTHGEYLGNRYYTGPTLNYVDMFTWEDGTDFPEDFDWTNPTKEPFFKFDGTKMVPTRDPRLYENVACPGDIYCNGTTAPVFMNHDSYKNGSGFLIMKYILQENSDRQNRPVQFAYLRLPELMLDYAEVLLESGGDAAEAKDFVNQIRNRVGLSPLADVNVDRILRERCLELGFEEVRWFDLVRRNMKSDFTKTLYGLRSKGNDNNNPTKFTFEKVTISPRFWAQEWDSKWYLAPIPQNEINKKYGMSQNPGW